MILRTDAEAGFVDIAANALAVLILVTIIVLIVSTVPSPRGEVRSDNRPTLPFPVEIDPSVQPFNSYWFVTEAGVTSIPLAEIAQRIFTGEKQIETVSGKFFFENSRRTYRDVAEFRLGYVPDSKGLSEMATPISDAASLAGLVEQFTNQFEDAYIVPTFFVENSGFDVFTELHSAMRTADLPLRWLIQRPGGKLTITRNVNQFETRAATWR